MKIFKAIILICLLSSTASFADDPEMQMIAKAQGYIDLLNGFYDMVKDTQVISESPEMTIIMQLRKMDDVYKDMGDRNQSIKELYAFLDKTDKPVIRNIVYTMLGDALKEMGRFEEAAEVLKKGINENIKAANQK